MVKVIEKKRYLEFQIPIKDIIDKFKINGELKRTDIGNEHIFFGEPILFIEIKKNGKSN